MSCAALAYCVARNQYDSIRRDTSSDRNELSASQKVFKEMLIRSMTNSSTKCVKTVSLDGSIIFIQCKSPPKKKRCRITTVDDFLELVDRDGIMRNVVDVRHDDLPLAITSLLMDRNWEGAKGTGEPQFFISKHKPKDIKVTEHPSRETQLLTEQYLQVVDDRKVVMQRMQDAKTPLRKIEKKMLDAPHAVDSVISVKGDSFHVQRTSATRKVIGCKILKAKIQEAVILTGLRDHTFDQRFRANIKTLLSELVDKAHRIKVKRVA